MSYACGLEIVLALALAGLFQRMASALRSGAPTLAQIEAWEQAQAERSAPLHLNRRRGGAERLTKVERRR